MHFLTRTRTLKAALAATLLGLASLAQAAVVLQATPAHAGTAAGTTSVAITATNLAPNTAVGAYEIELFYDAALWTPSTVQFSQYLGDVASFEALTEVDLTVAGLIRLMAISLLGPFDPLPLTAIQPAAGTAFSLVDISFTAVGTGTGSFRLGETLVTDEFGDAVNVVSEPSTIASLSLGMLALLAARGRRAGRCARVSGGTSSAVG